MKRWLLAAVLLLACFQTADSTPPRVSFIRPPRIVSDRDTWTLYVRTPRYAENHRLEVAAVEAGDIIAQTSRDMDGLNSPVLWNITWRLPDMDGELIAAIFGASGKELGRVTSSLCVRGTFAECPSLSPP